MVKKKSVACFSSRDSFDSQQHVEERPHLCRRLKEKNSVWNPLSFTIIPRVGSGKVVQQHNSLLVIEQVQRQL